MNGTKIFLRANTSTQEFEEFEIVIPGKELNDAEWELFKKMLPLAMTQAFPAEESEETKVESSMTTDLEVAKAA
jgi:hypothetical protein